MADLLSYVSTDVEIKQTGTTNGGEYHGPCPKCGGTDRFMVWPDQGPHGRFWCRGCGVAGDDVDYLVTVREMDKYEALEACGRSRKDQGQKNGRTISQKTTPERAKVLEELPDAWRDRARDLCNHAYKLMWSDQGKAARGYLNGRGLHDETIKAAALGYVDKEVFENPNAWGLSGEKKVWIPSPSIVIPKISDHKLYGVKFRRLEWDGVRVINMTEDPKYPSIRGSQPTLYGADQVTGHKIIFMTEGEFDALLLRQEAGDLAGVVTLGSASVHRIPDRDLLTITGVDLALVAYDVDGAGLTGSVNLCAEYPALIRPALMPGPGDLTDNHRRVDLRAWATERLIEHGADMTTDELRRTYDVVLREHEGLIGYLDNQGIPHGERLNSVEKEKHQAICMRLSRLIKAIRDKETIHQGG